MPAILIWLLFIISALLYRLQHMNMYSLHLKSWTLLTPVKIERTENADTMVTSVTRMKRCRERSDFIQITDKIRDHDIHITKEYREKGASYIQEDVCWKQN